MLTHSSKIFVTSLVTLTLLVGCGSSDGKIQEPAIITYEDHKGETRTAALNDGEAETIAGTGYQHTLFDSADKKCQHCHNELYDTWKTSMHSKSWSDKIFQSKHQDFLRVHISKIGTNPTQSKEYTTQVFQGAAKTCAKCHAPAAYYSGDFKVDIEKIDINSSIATTAEFLAAKGEHETNLASASDYSPHNPTTVVGTSSIGEIYKATYHIGNSHNREGINCATCHSIETVRMITDNGAQDGGMYTLAKDLRVGPHGAIKKDAGDTLLYSPDGTTEDMNAFFRLWGPEIYNDYHDTPKSSGEFDTNKKVDGRYTMKSVDLNGTDGKVHYTGGPFYGPYGVTGLSNGNPHDDTNRTAHLNPHFDKETNNHFGAQGKALCLACHQRSSGAQSPDGSFMELCSTWLVMSDGVGDNLTDSETSPKCQKCHMPRLEDKTLLHQWGKPNTLFTKDDTHLTDHFDPNSTTTTAADNPVKGRWLNDHAFVGGSKIGASNYKAKIQSGFDASLSQSLNGTSVTINTTLKNKTAHMFPGAHPMRRVLTRVILTNENGDIIPFNSATGNSTFDAITNTIVSGNAADKVDSTGDAEVTVAYDNNRVIDFPGQTPDLDGGAVDSQKFSGEKITITASDATVKEQNLSVDGKIQGTVTNAAIVNDNNMSYFTRIYGHETGKNYNGTFVVRPGFDSNVVGSDNRLLPNEEETYTINYNNLATGTYTVTYKVYYMQKGAGGSFPTATDGFLDSALNASKKLLISEVGTYEESITIN